MLACIMIVNTWTEHTTLACIMIGNTQTVHTTLACIMILNTHTVHTMLACIMIANTQTVHTMLASDGKHGLSVDQTIQSLPAQQASNDPSLEIGHSKVGIFLQAFF